LREQAVLSNVATVLTVSVAVVYMYGPFMQAPLGHPVSPGRLRRLAWLAASTGDDRRRPRGGGLADEETVRQAAHSARVWQRVWQHKSFVDAFAWR
jgi:hypothetical protein